MNYVFVLCQFVTDLYAYAYNVQRPTANVSGRQATQSNLNDVERSSNLQSVYSYLSTSLQCVRKHNALHQLCLHHVEYIKNLVKYHLHKSITG